MEYENKHGTCPLQLKTKLYEFVLNNRELPGSHNRGAQIYKALKRRYKDFSAALVAHGLPSVARKGTNMLYIFPDKTEYSYNINKLFDRYQLFNMIMEKCPNVKRLETMDSCLINP